MSSGVGEGLSALRLEVESDGRRLLDGASLSIRPGEVVGVVGPSGSGKSVLLRAMVGLLPMRPGLVGGEMRLAGEPTRPEALRGGIVGLLFQDARASLDPLRTVREQVAHAAALAARHGGAGAAAASRAVDADLRSAAFPANAADLYPHELSGGMAQRAAVACALARRSRFLFCDEPTTGLDAEVQAALVLELQTLARGPDARGIVFVTHDIALLDGFADRILVLDRGTIAEEAPTARALVGPGRALVEATLALQAGSS